MRGEHHAVDARHGIKGRVSKGQVLGIPFLEFDRQVFDSRARRPDSNSVGT